MVLIDMLKAVSDSRSASGMLTRRYSDLTNESALQIILVHSIIKITKNTPLLITLLVASTIIIPAIIAQPSFAQVASHKQRVVLTAIFVQLDNNRQLGKLLLDRALAKLKPLYPNLDIQLNYLEYPSNQIRSQILKTLNGTKTPGSVDLVSFDQIWLGEFAQKGLLTDLTNNTKVWGRQNDWYDENWNGGIYGGKVYGLWAWTDIRGMWYWKDLLSKAGVNPDSLKTWDGYIAAVKKLNSVLRPQGIEGVHLTGASHSPDLWYPYLWMLGGEILNMKSGHPTKGSYWFPAFNSTAGTRAMNFIKQQVDAGIKPQKDHFWGQEFLDRKFAVMIEGSWLPVPFFQNVSAKAFEDRVGFIPALPVPYKNNRTATLMGGYALGIPQTSAHKDLAWKLIESSLEPEIIGPFLSQKGLLPTQISMGTSDLLNVTASSYPYYRQLVSMIPFAGTRPSIPEYPQIANNIRQAIYEVQFENTNPDLALQEAAAKSAKALGW
ncbi:MAG TPA: extracellular solute-binding protein [Nitrososphaeraceae archaeon]|jgi:multiple sugar transport system substrate-binding protein